jgi:hypothetical protein
MAASRKMIFSIVPLEWREPQAELEVKMTGLIALSSSHE